MSVDRLEKLRALVERWDAVTLQVERGYDFSFDEYLNDMDLRRIVDEHTREIVSAGLEDIPESLSALLEVADARFRAATFTTLRNVWGGVAERDEGWNAEREWFYYRLPYSHSDWQSQLD